MSADNWTTCPRCFAKELKRVEDLNKQARESYGKVTAQRYAELLAESNQPMKVEETLREDYSIGLYEGKFEVSYAARCECGFTHTFKHTEPIKGTK